MRPHRRLVERKYYMKQFYFPRQFRYLAFMSVAGFCMPEMGYAQSVSGLIRSYHPYAGTGYDNSTQQQGSFSQDIPLTEEASATVDGDAVDPSMQPLQHFYDDLVSEFICDSLFWKKVKVAGYIAQSYTYNFNEPSDRINTFRAYDRIHNAYLLNTFQLSAYAASTTGSRLGFGIKVNAGKDTEVFVPFQEPTSDRVDLFEAWISYLVTDELLIKAGKMPTLAGLEVADEKDNYNISRGLLWSLLQPVTHTGIRATYTSSDEFYDLTFGVNRGWDTFRYDNNGALSYEARLGINQSEKFSYGITYLFGPEGVDDSSNLRHLIDFVTTYEISEKTVFGLNYDIRFDEGAESGGGTADSQGIASYLKHDFTNKASIATRLEGLRDSGAITGSKQTLAEATLTGQYKFRENLWGRLEFRHDRSSDSVFTQNEEKGRSQNTIAASVLFTF